MTITPLGAAGGEVTGSCYDVQTDQARILVDCGLFQGTRKTEELNRSPLGHEVSHLNAVLVTHAHLDHVGRLPLLVRAGFRGPMFATPATIEIAALVLHDAAKIQSQDADRRNRHLKRAGEPPHPPLYSQEDVDATLRCFRPIPYHQPIQVAPGIQAFYREAGHMLGSASIQLLVEENAKTKTIVFSGDLGPRGTPILKDSETFTEADLVILESTYGDRNHRPREATVDEFTHIVRSAVLEQGKIFVPTFAIGRAQGLIHMLTCLMAENSIPRFPVYLDSPMAIEASKIYTRHPELYDDDLLDYLKGRPFSSDFAEVIMTSTPDDSKRINDQPGPLLVLAGAGMCNAGRIVHHLRNSLWKPDTHVIIVGYQGYGTLGRQLVDGEKFVSIFGEKIAVKARIHTLGGFSAHAGQTDLLQWFESLARCRPRVILTHGEDRQRKALAKCIGDRHQIHPYLPLLGEPIAL